MDYRQNERTEYELLEQFSTGASVFIAEGRIEITAEGPGLETLGEEAEELLS